MDILDYFPISEKKKRDARLESCLESLLSDDPAVEGKYKMVAMSPLRYIGGKSRAIGYILERFPKGVGDRVVSPFFGGGSLEFVLSKKIGFEVVGYDVFDVLVNYWNYQLKEPEKLYAELKKLVPDAPNYKKNRHILLNYWNKVKPKTLDYETKEKYPLTDGERTMLDNDPLKVATYYYYNHQLSFGPQFLGWGSSIYLKEDRYRAILNEVRTFKAKKVTVSCASFESTVPKHDGDFIFADPPYYLDGDSKMFKGLYPNPNFAIHHDKFDHALLCRLLKDHKGGFLLTYNDCRAVREMYAEFDQYFPSWHYSYGQMETRVGKNRPEGDITKKSHEIIVVSSPR